MRTVRLTWPPLPPDLRPARQLDDEVVPAPSRLSMLDRTAVRLHDLMGDVEPEPEALRHRRTALLESFEDAGALLLVGFPGP